MTTRSVSIVGGCRILVDILVVYIYIGLSTAASVSSTTLSADAVRGGRTRMRGEMRWQRQEEILDEERARRAEPRRSGR
jgi:hypothetical protein